MDNIITKTRVTISIPSAPGTSEEEVGETQEDEDVRVISRASPRLAFSPSDMTPLGVSATRERERERSKGRERESE